MQPLIIAEYKPSRLIGSQTRRGTHILTRHEVFLLNLIIQTMLVLTTLAPAI